MVFFVFYTIKKKLKKRENIKVISLRLSAHVDSELKVAVAKLKRGLSCKCSEKCGLNEVDYHDESHSVAILN